MPSGLVVVALPCLNEETALPGLLARLDAVRPQLSPDWELWALVVDDGSTDRTAEIAAQWQGGLRVELVQHDGNQGLGVALVTAIGWFLAMPKGSGPAALGVMDADGTHPPELLPRMLATLVPPEGEPCDVVIASRYAPGGEEHGLPPLRRLYSALASGVLRVLAGIRGVRDYSCGYRLYGRAILDKAARYYGGRLVTERSFVCMAELLIKLGRRGARIAEVPLKLHYELKGGVSKMNVAATIRRYAVLAWRLLNDPGFR